jgi:ABC-type polar amino acid transport system ATPase subunit
MSQITMTPADAMITLENVNKWYGQFHVLKDINLKVKQGNASSFAALQVQGNPQPFAVLITLKNISRTHCG